MCTIFKWWFAQLTPYYITILLQALLSHDSHHCIFGVLELQLGLQREIKGDVQRRTSENSSKRNDLISKRVVLLNQSLFPYTVSNHRYSNNLAVLDTILFDKKHKKMHFIKLFKEKD